MLTPQEIQEKKFKQSFMGGYEMVVVDEFLEVLSDDYSVLFKENAVLKNKMKVLVDKIEEYRASEDSMRSAYLAIKQQADFELAEARRTSDIMIKEVRGEAESKRLEMEEELQQESKRLKYAQEQTVSFVNALRELYQRQIDQLSFIPTMEIQDTPREKRAEAISSAVREIEKNMTAKEDQPGIEEIEPEDATKAFVPSGEINGKTDSDESPTAEIPTDINEYVKKRTEKIVDNFEIHYGSGVLSDDHSDIWEQEFDTEIPRPKFEFPDLENQFGHDNSQPQKQNKKAR